MNTWHSPQVLLQLPPGLVGARGCFTTAAPGFSDSHCQIQHNLWAFWSSVLCLEGSLAASITHGSSTLWQLWLGLVPPPPLSGSCHLAWCSPWTFWQLTFGMAQPPGCFATAGHWALWKPPLGLVKPLLQLPASTILR